LQSDVESTNIVVYNNCCDLNRVFVLTQNKGFGEIK
jgi:hypothetical protein